ncbi:MAG TPA: ATP-binding protein, partial [Longimicrobium sp.]|nr:ATP-binding protein [Longimicrobium sp.]
LSIPLEHGQIQLSRPGLDVTFAARFHLLAAMSRCPCGNAGNPPAAGQRCRCTPKAIHGYHHRIPLFLAHRFDITLDVPPPPTRREDGSPPAPTATYRARVEAARERQAHRYAGLQHVTQNAQLPAPLVSKFCSLSRSAALLLEETFRNEALPSFASVQLLAVSRSCADLHDHEDIQDDDLALALSMPPFTDPGSYGPDVKRRAEGAAAALEHAEAKLRGLLEKPRVVAPPALRTALFAASRFGVMGAVPLPTEGDGPEAREALVAQAGAVQEELARRLTAVRAVAGSTAAADVARLQSIFGADFRVLPPFVPAQAAELGTLFGATEALLGDAPMELTTWFQRAARIRDGVERLDAALLYAEALGGPTPAFKVAQLGSGAVPYPAGERWVGLPPQEGKPFPADRLSIVTLVPGALELSRPVCGLFVDEWGETVPSATETTGVAFQFDQPGSRPPQAVLLAVPPDPASSRWDTATLVAVVRETLELSKLRLVDPEALGGMKHFLPALYFANNVAGEAVETNFARFAHPRS